MKQQTDIKARILKCFSDNPLSPFDMKDIQLMLHIRDRHLQPQVRDAFAELAADGRIEKYNRARYILAKSQIKTKTGTVSIVRSGAGFVKLDDQKETEQDVSIEARDITSNRILDGDRVDLYIQGRSGRNGRLYGKVIRIAKRRTAPVIGVINILGSYAVMETEALRTAEKVFIPSEYFKGAHDGDKVSVRVIDWPKNSKSPQGKVTEVLGKPGENDTEMHAILSEFDLPYTYPQRLEKLAERIESGITEEEIAKRRDMRGICTFTIDPKTAKDFDDALSYRKLDDGRTEVGVHIADVTHYVHQGDDIDGEGYERATSVYLVDRTVPMLPEKLSNFLCSLRPDEDKLCFSAIFTLDAEGEVKSTWFGKTVIRSVRRLDYDQAQEIIEGRKDPLSDAMKGLDALAKKLRERRFKDGAINFEREEPQFEMDENGKPLRIYFKSAMDSNQLIEEFMLLANRSVAEYIGKMKKAFVYRVHDLPEKDKYERFISFITRFGYQMKSTSTKNAGAELSKLLGKVKGKPEESLISILAIRSMAKAAYTTHNIGHYGLAFKYYTHFTSPIRRYPDMMVHRLLERYLAGGPGVQDRKLEEYCQHCSDMEVKANEAERSSIKYKMVEFMQDKVGREFEGTVTSLTDWGMYVELDENRIEGMISLRGIDNDFYNFNREDFEVEGSRFGITFTLGSRVRVFIEKADLERKQLDFKLLGFYDRKGRYSMMSSFR